MPRSSHLLDDLTVDPEFLKLPAQEQDALYEELSKSAAPSASRTSSPLDSPLARVLFPGTGQILGGAAGTGLGAVAGGVGAVPGGFIGATTGAGAGEATRQILSHLLGGGPKTNTEAMVGPLTQATIAALGEGAGPALGMAKRGIVRGGKAVVSELGNLLSGVPKGAIGRALERGPSTVIKKEFLAGLVPESLSEKVIAGMTQFRDAFEKQYDQGVAKITPLIQQSRTNISEAVQGFRDRLIKSGILSENGTPLEPILPKGVSASIAQARNKLQSILKRVDTLAGGTGEIPTHQAIQLKRELDTLLDYTGDAVREIPKSMQGAIFGLRTALREATERAVPELAALNGEYHSFRDLYDTVQPALKDARLESTLQSLAGTRNRFRFTHLEAINNLLAPEQQFMNQALDFLAGKEFGKNPRFFRELLEIGAGGRFGGVPGAMAGAILSHPQALGAALKGGEALGAGLSSIGRRLPTLPASGVSTLLRLLGISNATQ